MATSVPFKSQILLGRWASPEGCHLNVLITSQSEEIATLKTKLFVNGKEFAEQMTLNLGTWKDTIVTLQNAIIGEPRTSIPYTLVLESGEQSDTLTGQVNIVDNDWHRNILVEEGTGTWCGNCPRGIVGMELMKEDFPDSFVGISMHYANSHSEPMGYQEYGRFLVDNDYITAFPQAAINRVLSEIDPLNDAYLGGYYQLALQEATPATIACTAEYRNDYKTVRLKATGILDMVEAGHEYGFSFCCIENDVHQPGDPYYSQANNYGNNAYGEFYGYEKYAGRITPDSMWYQEVARYYVEQSFDGIRGSIATPLPGVPFEYSCDLDLPATVLNPDNLCYIAMIFDSTTGEVLNCVEVEEREVVHGWSVPLLYEDFAYGLFRQGFVRIDADGNNPFSSMGLSAGDAWGIGEEDGNYYAYSTSYYSPSGQSDDWLMTPAIPIAHVLEAGGDLKLSWIARSSSSKYTDGYEVKVSTGGSETSDFADTPIFATSGESAEWTEHEITLEGVQSDSIRIAFRNVTNNGEKLLLDDLRLYTSIASSLSQSRLNKGDKATQTRIYSLEGQYLGSDIETIRQSGSMKPHIVIARQQAADGSVTIRKIIF